MNKTIRRLLNWAAKRSDVLATARADYYNVIERNRALKTHVTSLESDVCSYQRAVGRFAERMAKVRVYEGPRTYRVCVDIDHGELSRLFDHGVNEGGMDMVGEWIGRRAAQAIRECNVVRWAGEVTP